jgi:predicted RNase H-like nuclease (RuvC/YqgF family)
MKFKKFLLLILFGALLLDLQAQSIKVKKEKARVKGENVEGFEVELPGSYGNIHASFTKFLKNYGKTRGNDPIVVSGVSLGTGSTTAVVYGVVKEKEKDKSSHTWLGIRKEEWPEDAYDKCMKELEKMIYDFGKNYHQDLVQNEIDESITALNAVEKQQQRLVTENKNLKIKLEDNKREKLQLEKSLENNKLEYETMLLKIENNQHAQDSVAQAGVQIKKVIESQKEKKKKVN